jgi:hypothetical protein
MMTFPNPGVVLITGIMAAGKSTIAQAVAERMPMSVHLRGDLFRRMIVNGQAAVEPDNMDAAMEQLRLRYRLAAMVADGYCKASFTVVYQDVILGESLGEVVEMLKAWQRHVVVLCPTPAVAGARDEARSKTGYGEWTPQMLDRSLREETPRLGFWLDNSDLTVEATVDAIFAHVEQTKQGLMD